jgi:hypothetical protein
MTAPEWIAALVGAAGLGVSLAGWFIFAGKFHQKVEDLKDQVKNHDAAIIAMQQVMNALQASADRVVTAIDAQKQIWAGEIGRLSDKVEAGHKLIDAKLEGGDRLAARELEQLKHDMRNVRDQIDRLPHPRRRSTTE